jgi:hypothetical protein
LVGLSDAYEKSALLAEFEQERSRVSKQKARALSDLWECYRDARLEDLKSSLLMETDWLSQRNWCVKDESGRILDIDLPVGTGFQVYFAGEEKHQVGRSVILVDLPFDQPMYRVFLSGNEEKTQRLFFSAKEVISRIGELMFDCDHAMKGKTGESVGGHPVDRD